MPLGDPVGNLLRYFARCARGPCVDPLIEGLDRQIRRVGIELPDHAGAQCAIHALKQFRQKGRVDGIHHELRCAQGVQRAVEQALVSVAADAAMEQQAHEGDDIVFVVQLKNPHVSV